MDSCSGGSALRVRDGSRLTSWQCILLSWRVSGYSWGSTWELRLGEFGKDFIEGELSYVGVNVLVRLIESDAKIRVAAKGE